MTCPPLLGFAVQRSLVPLVALRPFIPRNHRHRGMPALQASCHGRGQGLRCGKRPKRVMMSWWMCAYRIVSLSSDVQSSTARA